MTTRTKPKKNFESILPSDSILYKRARHFSKIMEKYSKADESQDLDMVEYEDILLSSNPSDEEENNDNKSDASISDPEFENKNCDDENNSSSSFKEVLNETLKIVEKRKKIWKEAGIDDVMKSFCLEEIDKKVGTWLQKYVQNPQNDNYDTSIEKNQYNESTTINMKNSNLRKIKMFDNHSYRQHYDDCDDNDTQWQQKQQRQQQKHKRQQLKKHNYNEIYNNNDGISEESSLESVDTAKYILSNRKPYKTKTNTMTIKRFCNIREKNLLMHKNSKMQLKQINFLQDPSYSRIYHHHNDELIFLENSTEESSDDNNDITIRGKKYSSSHRKRQHNKSNNRTKNKRDYYYYQHDRSYKQNYYQHNRHHHNSELKLSPNYNGISKMNYLSEKLKRDMQLKELSLLALARRTPSPQPSSLESQSESEDNTTLQNTILENKKSNKNSSHQNIIIDDKDDDNRKLKNSKPGLNTENLKRIQKPLKTKKKLRVLLKHDKKLDHKLLQEKIQNKSQSIKNTSFSISSITSFNPQINSTATTSKNLQVLRNNSYLNKNNDICQVNNKNNKIKSSSNNINESKITNTNKTIDNFDKTKKSNLSDITVIYSPNMNLTNNTSLNSTIIIQDGKLKLTKDFLEDSIGEKYTEKLLKNNNNILNKDISADSKIIFIQPQLSSDELSSDEDPISYLWKPKEPKLIEITASGKKNLIERD